jgi:hypothetical protein
MNATKKKAAGRKKAAGKVMTKKTKKMIKDRQPEDSVMNLDAGLVEILVPIIGITPLRMDALPATTKEDLRNRNFPGFIPPKRGPVHPIQQFCSSIHCRDGGSMPTVHDLETPFIAPFGPEEPLRFKASLSAGFPAVGFKNAMVDGARNVDGVTKVSVENSVFVLGDLVPVNYESVEMIEEFVQTKRAGRPGPTVAKYMSQFNEWTADICVAFNDKALTLVQVLMVIGEAGLIGAGTGRPGLKKTTYGMYQICPDVEIQYITPKHRLEYLISTRKTNRGAQWLTEDAWNRALKEYVAKTEKEMAKIKARSGKNGNGQKKTGKKKKAKAKAGK